jgi:hypothetical protein
MSQDKEDVKGIRAGKIIADNVVQGAQVLGGDPKEAAALVSLAQGIRSGTISADEIKAKNLVSGLQYIADPSDATVEDLRKELANLRTQLEQSIAGGEFGNAADAEDAKDALSKVESELASPQPQGGRVVRKLGEVSEIVTRGAEVAEATGKIGSMIIKLAPIAATVWQVALKLFGG